MRKYLLTLFFGLFYVQSAFCAPSNSMSITPSASDGTTITASDENTRNNEVSTKFNAHDHNDIDQAGNTLSLGDATAGNKEIQANNADSNKPFLRYDDTNNRWIISEDGTVTASLVTLTGVEIFYKLPGSMVQGDIIYAGPSGLVRLAAGTSGQHLRTQGASANPTWSSVINATSGTLTGITSFAVTYSTVNTGFNADMLDGSHASTTTGSAVIPIADASGYLPDNSVDTSALKTAIGEVGGSAGMFTLPGGTYGFYPQIKRTGGGGATVSIASGGSPGVSYATVIQIVDAVSDIYAQQRYVTASGKDYWLFLLINKTTGEIEGGYSAPDHPAYGNGGDFNKMSHPFGVYDEMKYEIVLVDRETVAELREQVTDGRSLLVLVNEEFKPNMSKEEPYIPLHSGRFLGQEPELVQTIPSYIKVRKLLRMTDVEKTRKKAGREREESKLRQARGDKKQIIKQKLSLTDEDLATLKEALNE